MVWCLFKFKRDTTSYDAAGGDGDDDGDEEDNRCNVAGVATGYTTVADPKVKCLSLMAYAAAVPRASFASIWVPREQLKPWCMGSNS